MRFSKSLSYSTQNWLEESSLDEIVRVLFDADDYTVGNRNLEIETSVFSISLESQTSDRWIVYSQGRAVCEVSSIKEGLLIGCLYAINPKHFKRNLSKV